MRTFIGIIAGFLLTSLLILAGEWAYTMVASPSLQAATTLFAFILALISLLYIGIGVTVGGYLAGVIDDSRETTSGFAVLQLFFGVWFFREFWTSGFAWYKLAALVLVIPCAMLGRHWAKRAHRNTMASDSVAHQAAHQ